MKIKEFIKKLDGKLLNKEFRKGMRRRLDHGEINKKIFDEMLEKLNINVCRYAYENGVDIDNPDLVFESFDYDTAFAIAIRLNQYKKYPPTIGRYIAALLRIIRDLEGRNKYEVSIITKRNDKICKLEKEIVNLHKNSTDKKTTDQIEQSFSYLFFNEEGFYDD